MKTFGSTPRRSGCLRGSSGVRRLGTSRRRRSAKQQQRRAARTLRRMLTRGRLPPPRRRAAVRTTPVRCHRLLRLLGQLMGHTLLLRDHSRPEQRWRTLAMQQRVQTRTRPSVICGGDPRAIQIRIQPPSRIHRPSMMMMKKTRGWGCMGMSFGEAVAEVVVVGAVAVAVAIRSTTPWGERWRMQRRGAGWE